MPDSLFKKYFEILIACMLLYSMIVIPLKSFLMSEIEQPPFFLVIDIIFDLIFMLEIVVKFFYAYSNRGKVITNFKQISRRYLFGYFFLDVLCILPYYGLPF